jgi:hypothetical protein
LLAQDARDIARGVNIGGARFEKSVQQDTAIDREAGLFGQRQTWSDPEPAEVFDSSLRIRHARV